MTAVPLDGRASLAADLAADLRLTRGLLTRVPAASLDWAPHARSFTLGGLATHLAELPHWGGRILTADGYDLSTATGRHPARASLDDILATFDRHVSEVTQILAAQSPDTLAADWTLRRGPDVVLTLSRADALRRFLLHHVIHHRGQLTVYLRLLDVALPPLYRADGRRIVVMRAGVLGALLVCFAVLATANSGGYRYGISDQAFYAPAILMTSHADLFPRDRALLEPQMRLWPGGRILAALTQWAGGDIQLVFALFYALTLAVLAWSAVSLGQSLGLDWRAIVVFLALLTLRHRIAKTGANSLEGYAHPRMLAFAVGLAVFAAIARGHRARAVVLSALSIVIHTTTGAWFALVVALSILWPHRHRRWMLLGAGVLLAGAMLALFTPGSPFSLRMDTAWLSVLEQKDYLFPAEWPAYAWVINLAYPLVFWLVFRRRQAHGVLAPGETALVAGLLGLAALFLISVPFAQARLAFVVQLQINRIFWLLDAATMLAIAWLAIDLAQGDRPSIGAGRTTTAAWGVIATLCLVASVRGYYVLRVEAHRPLVQVRPEANTWMETMIWLSRQPVSWHVLADPGHVWKYGLSVRVAAARDVLLEAGKDTAIAMYDRDSALRVAERSGALAGFDTMTTAEVRTLKTRYGLDVLVDRATRTFNLPVLYRNHDFVVYDLR